MTFGQKVKKLKKELVKSVKENPDQRDALLLISMLTLFESSIENKKIDAVSMGVMGMSIFFETAPEDCGRLGAKLVEAEDGSVKVEIFPTDDPDFGKAKVRLD